MIILPKHERRKEAYLMEKSFGKLNGQAGGLYPSVIEKKACA